jgi:hypothetical protein
VAYKNNLKERNKEENKGKERKAKEIVTALMVFKESTKIVWQWVDVAVSTAQFNEMERQS